QLRERLRKIRVDSELLDVPRTILSGRNAVTYHHCGTLGCVPLTKTRVAGGSGASITVLPSASAGPVRRFAPSLVSMNPGRLTPPVGAAIPALAAAPDEAGVRWPPPCRRHPPRIWIPQSRPAMLRRGLRPPARCVAPPRHRSRRKRDLG